MLDRIKVAAAQTNPGLMKTKENLSRIMELIEDAADHKANLVVFPECSLTGYVYRSKDEAMPHTEPIPGPSTQAVSSLCKKLNIYAIYGLLEKAGEKIFNALAFVGPQGVIAGYRKIHLPVLGIDRFATPGDIPFQVHQTPIGNIGMHICYDIQFPESARIMSLMGADIIVLSTNFPDNRAEKMNCLVRSRALENKVHLVCSDRIGTERGVTFDGYSTVINAKGDVLSTASHAGEELIYAEVSLAEARQKHHVFIPGEWEIDNINSRRPEFYGIITRPKTEKS